MNHIIMHAEFSGSDKNFWAPVKQPLQSNVKTKTLYADTWAESVEQNDKAKMMSSGKKILVKGSNKKDTYRNSH